MTLRGRIVVLAAALSCATGAAWGGEPAQSHVLEMRREQQSNIIPDPELQGVVPAPPSEIVPAKPAVTPPPAPPARAARPARPAPPRMPDETPLWDLLAKERYADLERAIARVRKAYPHWTPPRKLFALKREGEARRQINEAVETRNWKNVVALAKRHPEQFICDQIYFMWGLAEAYHALGDTASTIAVFERVIPRCPKAADRITTLQKASTILTPEIFAQLQQREERGARRDEASQAQFDRVTYEFHLRQLLDASAIKDRAKAGEIIAAIERVPLAQRDARYATLAGWIYLNAGQDEDAIKWFDTALNWKPIAPDVEDARYGFAMANFRLSQRDDPESVRLRASRMDVAEAALSRANPDEPRHRELLGDIMFARAGAAFDGKDYAQSLAYVEQAEALGKRGRDLDTLRAWLYFQFGDDPKAAAEFTDLYRAQPDKDIAQGLVLTLSRSQDWDALMKVSQEVGGPIQGMAEAANVQRYHDRKLFLTAERVLPGYFPELDHIDASSVGVGISARYKPGADGTSQLRMLRVPVVESVHVFGAVHELRLQLDRVELSTGTLPAFSLIGTFPAAGGYVVAPTTELANGFEPLISYRHQDWLTTYASLGLTPTGGVIASAPVGNLGFAREFKGGNWGMELFSQPMRESMLSYTGIVDPYTGLKWGRVRRSGGLIRAYAATPRFNISGLAQAAHLEGANVANNQAVKLNLSIVLNLVPPGPSLLSALDYFTVGPNVTYEAYRKNLSQFTFGQGGYYSPRRVTTLGLVGQFLSREARQYAFRGDVSIGRFNLTNDASPCFPLGGVAPPLNPTCVTGFAASSRTGDSYSAQLVGVRRMSDYLQLGGGFIWRRSPQYDDKLGMLFLRYSFFPRAAVMSSDIPDAAFQRLY